MSYKCCVYCGGSYSMDGVHVCPQGTRIEAASGGGKLTGKHYYQVSISEPMNPLVQPYTAECADIIEALGMTFNEGEAFKALWRGAAGRTLGLKKNDAQYDADKAAHYSQRHAIQVRKAGQA